MQITLTVQQTKVYQLLINNKSVSTYDILSKSIRNPSQIIGQLKSLGADITKVDKPCVDNFGVLKKRTAFYTLVGWSDE